MFVSLQPVPHFGDAQRKIMALQFPKFASAVLDCIPPRAFIKEFHWLLFVAPVPLYAVKLDPAVVATFAHAGAMNAAQTAQHKKCKEFLISLYAL
jgi:hypothetical protein